MKTLDSNILTKLNTLQGTEPTVIVSIEWGDSFITYSDKNLPGVYGKIINIGTINHQLVYNRINSSTVDIVLDDSDNLVRGYYNTRSLHKRRCYIYHNYEGTGKFTIFKGLTNSPIVWNESERTISFTVLSEVEDKEIGFSPEESQYDYVSEEAVGKAWPLCFGDVLHVPAVLTRSVPSGTLKTRIGLVDSTLRYKLEAIINAYFMKIFIYNYYKSIASRAQSVLIANLGDAIRSYQSNLAQWLGVVPRRPTESVTEAYCEIIGAEDQINIDLEDLENLLKQQKQDYDLKKQGKLLWGNFTPKQVREQMKETRAEIKEGKEALRNVVKAKKEVEKAIDELEWELDVQHVAFQKQTQAFNDANALYIMYIDVLNEYCAQKKMEVSTIYVDQGNDFPQNQSIELLINDMRVRGKFSGKKFTVEAVLPKYRNVPLGDFQSVNNDCSEYDGLAQLNTFWVKDRNYSLKNNWCLVKSKRGTYHIIFIEDQEGTECKYKLVEQGGDYSGFSGDRGANQLFQSTITFPVYRGANVPKASSYAIYNTPRGRIEPLDWVNQNSYLGNFVNYVNQALKNNGALPLDADEYFNLQRLQRMYRFDIAENYIWFQPLDPRVIYNLISYDIEKIVEVAPAPLATWLEPNKNIDVSEIPDQAIWEGQPGSTVIDFNNPYMIYIANILESDVKAVMAYKTNERGEQYLEVVPSDYYTLNEAEDLGALTVTSIKFYTPLSSIQGEGWENQIYVSLRSSVGPNVVDILTYIIDTYTDKQWDSTTFNHVKSLFDDKYPANFALFERKNVLTILQEIAFQARCSLCLIEDKFYLYYLAEEPTTVKEITNADIETGSLILTYSDTESLVTKLTSTWRPDYLPDTKDKKIILRHNIHKYGLHESEIGFYIYNIRSLVIKSATFWLLRYANTWKQLSFKTFLKHLDLELYDALSFNASDAPNVKTVIESINYNPAGNDLSLNLWLPLRDGDTDQYPFAWPSETSITYPLDTDDAGGNTITIDIPTGE